MGFLECEQELRRRLLSMREERGLSQDRVSEELLGYHRKAMQSRLSRLENGKAAFTLLDLFMLADLFGKSFFHGVGFPFEDVTITGARAEAEARAGEGS